ncbi:MAG: hypothetical protein M1833_002123 [Piccolia ochrophora]|nr:MAG: hypothetical protein M1833_002123 [Piccolia ochrophora]
MSPANTDSMNPSTPSTDVGSKRSGRSNKPSKIIILHLSPKALARFSPKPSLIKGSSRSKSSASSNSTPVPPVEAASSADNPSDSNSTPAPAGTPNETMPRVSTDGVKRKGIPGPKPGTKRTLGGGQEGVPKVRGKPGPKKKPRLEDGTIDHGDGKGPLGTSGAFASHKLGPKANQGAINAGLRALDRSGKPCRKWERKGFHLKSFTGVVWQIPLWRAPKSKGANGEVTTNGDGSASLGVDSESKENKGSSAVDSQKSSSGGDADLVAAPSNNASSPVPAVATPT